MAKLIRRLIEGLIVTTTETRHESVKKAKSRKMFSPTKPYQTPYVINGELIIDCLICDSPVKHREASYVKVLTGEFKKDNQTDLLTNSSGHQIEVQRGVEIEIPGYTRTERKPIKFDKWLKGLVCPNCSVRGDYKIIILKTEHVENKRPDEHFEHEFGYGKKQFRNITHKRRASKLGRTAGGWHKAHEGRNG